MNPLRWFLGEDPKPRFVPQGLWQAGEPPKYAFCESATVATAAPWHIRQVGNVGLKLGGGVDTPSLCGHVKPLGMKKGFGGWDLNVRITDHHLSHCCQDCAKLYREATK